MRNLETDKTGLARMIGRFPEQEAQMCRLYVCSAAFRDICADFLLALDTLARFRDLGGENRAAEIADYTRLVPELEAEIAALLSAQ
jgi:hypothetical protein